MGKRGVVRIGQAGCDGVASLKNRSVLVCSLRNGGFLGFLSGFATSLFGHGASCPISLGIVAGKSVRWSTVDPFAEIGDEERVLDVGKSREGLDFGVCIMLDEILRGCCGVAYQ